MPDENQPIAETGDFSFLQKDQVPGSMESGIPNPEPRQGLEGQTPVPSGGSLAGRPTDKRIRAQNASKTPEKKIPDVQRTTEDGSGATGAARSSWALGYAIAVTVLLFFCLLTGRLSLRGNHVLESLPDLRPLGPNEFRKVPEGAELPAGHLLRPGQSRRFGDVVVTPLRVTEEPLKFEGFLSGKPEPELTTEPVLKLWVRFDSEADYSFPPFDSGLMSHRMPIHGTDESTLANSWLLVRSGNSPPVRVLNYLQTMDSNFVIAGQNSGSLLTPGQSVEVCYASSTDISGVGVLPDALLTWRIQIRKGVHQSSGHGVTTLIDVEFRGSDIQVAGPAEAEHDSHLRPRIAMVSRRTVGWLPH